MALEGVRVGPLDPDKGEMFGQVGSTNSARQLIRHHQAMHPPALVAALGLTRQSERSDALVRDELPGAVDDYYGEANEALPDGAVINGASVRGEEDGAQQVVTFSWVVPPSVGGSGRSGKGFIPYDADTLAKSYKAGTEAVRVAKLKSAGLPWSGASPEIVEVPDPAVVAENEELHKALDEMHKRVAELEQERENAAATAAAATPPSPVVAPASPEQAVAGAVSTEDADPQMPWPGYDDLNADDVRSKLREADAATVQRALAYERVNKNRGTVVSAAQQILDRPGE